MDRGRRLREALVDRLIAEGRLADRRWRAAFRAVPRHLFVDAYQAPPDADRLAAIYRDVPLATHRADGAVVSSSSQPSLMAEMLQCLDVEEDSRVLEIGTGTGYNAALLSHRLGGDHVVTVDLEEAITGPARAALHAAGHHPLVVTGDGALGHPPGAPYDRIIGTCQLPRIPRPWLEQTRPGGVILTPLGTGIVRLRVDSADFAEGRFLATEAYFVSLRTLPSAPSAIPAPPAGGEPRITTTAELWPVPALLDGVDLPFLLSLGHPGLRYHTDTGGTWHTLSLTDGAGSAATLSPDGSLLESGPRSLWAETSALAQEWEAAGRPNRARYGLTVTTGEQRVWVDTPDSAHHWTLP